jgi:hypothetical protein
MKKVREAQYARTLFQLKIVIQIVAFLQAQYRAIICDKIRISARNLVANGMD